MGLTILEYHMHPAVLGLGSRMSADIICLYNDPFFYVNLTPNDPLLQQSTPNNPFFQNFNVKFEILARFVCILKILSIFI